MGDFLSGIEDLYKRTDLTNGSLPGGPGAQMERFDAATGRGGPYAPGYNAPELTPGTKSLMDAQIARGGQAYTPAAQQALSANVNSGAGQFLSHPSNGGMSDAISQMNMRKLDSNLAQNNFNVQNEATKQNFQTLGYSQELQEKKADIVRGLNQRLAAANQASDAARAQLVGGLVKPVFSLVGTAVGAYLGGPTGAKIGGAAGGAFGGAAVTKQYGRDTDLNEFSSSTESRPVTTEYGL